MNSKINLRFSILAIMVLVAALSRLLPHPPNFTPIGGMALFGAAYFGKKYLALIVPFVALWVSSLIIDNVVYGQYYDHFVWFSNPWVYVAFAAIVGMGFLLLKKVKPGNLLAASLLGSSLFFLISNFGTWMTGTMYPMTAEGLITCYTAGLPFFLNTLAGDLIYTAVLFGAFEMVQKNYPVLRTA